MPEFKRLFWFYGMLGAMVGLIAAGLALVVVRLVHAAMPRGVAHPPELLVLR